MPATNVTNGATKYTAWIQLAVLLVALMGMYADLRAQLARMDARTQNLEQWVHDTREEILRLEQKVYR